MKCLSIIARGFSHNCTPGTRHLNLQTLVLSDPLGAEQIAAAVIAGKEASPSGTGADLINVQRLGLRLRLEKASNGMRSGLRLTVIFESYKHELEAY